MLILGLVMLTLITGAIIIIINYPKVKRLADEKKCKKWKETGPFCKSSKCDWKFLKLKKILLCEKREIYRCLWGCVENPVRLFTSVNFEL